MEKLFGFLLIIMCLFGEKAPTNNYDKIKHFIIASYQDKYANLNFKPTFIQIQPTLHINLNEVVIINIKMGKNALRQKSGIAIAVVQKGSNKISLPISYNIDGTLEVLRSLSLIKSTQNITSINAKKETIPIQNFKTPPVCAELIEQISAKSIISANTIITTDKIQNKVLIRKNESFNGIFTQDSIQIQIPIIALENGIKGQIIKAMNPESKKILRVRVIDNQLGKIL